MSLYLGKVNNIPILHVTNSVTDSNSMKTLSILPNTVFHSSSTFASVQLISTVYSVDNYYDFSGSAITDIINYHDMVLPSEVYDAITGITNDSYFIITKHFSGSYKIPILPSDNMYSVYSIAWTQYPSNGLFDVFSYVNYTTKQYHIVAPYSYTSDPSPSGTTSITYVYKINYITPSPSGGIQITAGNLIIGNTNFKNYVFLNMFQNNTLDTLYTTTDLTIQLLNSKSGEIGYNGIRIKNNSIYSSFNNEEHLLFGHAYKNTSSVILSADFSLATSCILPISSTQDSLIIVSPASCVVNTPSPFNATIPSYMFSGNQSFTTYAYYSNNVYDEGSVVTIVYDVTTKALSAFYTVWGGGATSDYSISMTCNIKVLK